jgi:unsaturated rhamnogalacturonyl hydrolase
MMFGLQKTGLKWGRHTLWGYLFLVGSSMGCSSTQEATPPAEPAFSYTCQATSIAGTGTFASEHDPASPDIKLAKEIALRHMAMHPPEKLAWDWGESTLMLGMIDLYRVTGDPALKTYYQTWLDHHIKFGYKIVTSDSCPPALTALALYQESCAQPYRDVVDDVLDHLYHRSLRIPEGGINHLGSLELFPPSIWLDSLFMFGNVLTRWGESSGDRKALNEFSNQFGIFTSILQESSGFFKHAYGWGGSQDDNVYWARGNAWVTAVGYEYLRVRKARGEQDPVVEQALKKQVAAILAAQDPSTGLWWTVLNQPGTNYLETSASALFALGLARGYRYGFLDNSVVPTIQKAMVGVHSKITPDDQNRPVVRDISGPTTVGTAMYYAGIKVNDDISYGVGATILALIETSGLK